MGVSHRSLDIGMAHAVLNHLRVWTLRKHDRCVPVPKGMERSPGDPQALTNRMEHLSADVLRADRATFAISKEQALIIRPPARP